MKRWKKLVIVMVCSMLLVLVACSQSGSGEDEALFEAVRGDIAVVVNGTGNIATGHETKLSFGPDGEIDDISCEEGQAVAEGEALASLRTRKLSLQEVQAGAELAEAEAALAEAKTAVTRAVLAKQTAAHELEEILDSEAGLKMALLDTQISLEQAQRALRTGINAVDYRAAEANLRKAESWYNYLTGNSQESAPSGDNWEMALERAEDNLAAARADYDNVLSGYDTQEINIKKNQVASAEIAVAQARDNLEDLVVETKLKETGVTLAGEAVEQAQLTAVHAEQALELARQALEDASQDLAEATIRAPFAGVVAAVYADEGDTIIASSPVVHLVNPGQLELIIEVDEMDIPGVAEGQRAIVSVDALPDTTFHGNVAAIYPVPTKDTGLVMYNVKVSLEGAEGTSLKVGMRASADIVVGGKTGVIKVPSRAIQAAGDGGYNVTVIAGNKTETRPVTIGISNDEETEITSGLSKGEIIAG